MLRLRLSPRVRTFPATVISAFAIRHLARQHGQQHGPFSYFWQRFLFLGDTLSGAWSFTNLRVAHILCAFKELKTGSHMST